jgi:hypothetical protein
MNFAVAPISASAANTIIPERGAGTAPLRIIFADWSVEGSLDLRYILDQTSRPF